MIENQKIREFQKRLNQAMELKNINGAELGRLINKSRAAVSQYRNNRENLPPYDIIVDMAEALNVNVEWLNLETNTLITNIHINKKIEEYKKQLNKARNILLEYLEEVDNLLKK